jgi:LexA-binding, inner membrane-associated putative hydrolase
MPSPIGHALGGLVIGWALAPYHAQRNQPDPPNRPHQPAVIAAVIAACAPDLDFLWGRHNMETHSVVVAVAVALAVWAVTRRPRLALVCGLAWASHVLFDWLGSDDSPPLGVMALWPLTARFYFADAYVFEAISRRYAEPGFVQQNVWAVTKELLILVPPAALLWWWRGRPLRE